MFKKEHYYKWSESYT